MRGAMLICQKLALFAALAVPVQAATTLVRKVGRAEVNAEGSIVPEPLNMADFLKTADFPLQNCQSNESLDCVEYNDICHDFDVAAVWSMFGNIKKSKEASGGLEKFAASAKITAKPMIWIHIHKNAGTTMCALAAANGEKIISPHHNCNWDQHDQCGQTGKHVLTSCETRQKAFVDQGATWGQIEREVHEDDFCEGFRYGIMLRDPVDHAVSTTLFGGMDPTPLVTCIREGSCQGAFPPPFHVYDNFMIRRMLGNMGFAIQPGKVTRQHAQQVIEILEQKFEVVALLHNFSNALPAKLGWKEVDLHENSVKHDDELSTRFSSEELHFIYENTQMDRMVYEHFGGVQGKKY